METKVTNEWTNRLIGDRSATPEKKVLAAGVPVFGPSPPDWDQFVKFLQLHLRPVT